MSVLILELLQYLTLQYTFFNEVLKILIFFPPEASECVF